MAVSLVSRAGYFRQEIDDLGRQREHPQPWNPSQFTRPLQARVCVPIAGRDVWIGGWLYVVQGHLRGRQPVILLDTDMPENHPDDRAITSHLYGGDAAYRLRQEIVLGIGGVRMLDALGFEVRQYHLNEGHSALLTLQLLQRFAYRPEEVRTGELPYDVHRVRALCNFTTHTPVDAGHDRFSYELVRSVLGDFIVHPVSPRLRGATPSGHCRRRRSPRKSSARRTAKRAPCVPEWSRAQVRVGIEEWHDCCSCGQQPCRIARSSPHTARRTAMYTAGDLMTPDPIVVRETATVSEAVRIFQALEVRHLPVVNAAHELVGMLSDRDLRAFTIPDMIDGEWVGVIQLALEARVATLMSSDPLSVSLDADAPEIIDLMLDNKIGAVPVVDADGRIAGIVSYVDLLRALSADDCGDEAAQ